ncbi:hypothetical protein POX_b02022 [Penicillium oxalicum]|uniref:hypothetical protein n=1 Tax=Penicillium oxalicum TaxID=69781 RepID=UPI0020B8C552|nr:hypothetical protein POX_b02022 [Penicillium oxalicum]KAI2791991.1 hypothetical protein POX_b02022 [Penicillium oxalicum]
MLPSETSIAEFLSFAPAANAETAVVFLQQCDTINEAVDQYYHNPHKYVGPSRPSVSPTISLGGPTSPRFTAITSCSEQSTIDPVEHRNLSSAHCSSSLSRSQRDSSLVPDNLHTNALIEATKKRAVDEQQVQNMRLAVQTRFRVYNSEIEPERECEYPCNCPIHKYVQKKAERLPIQEQWARAVMYPGEKHYYGYVWGARFFNHNPYQGKVISPYGYVSSRYLAMPRPDPTFHAKSLHQAIEVNEDLNSKAQLAVDALEPSFCIWDVDQLEKSISALGISSATSQLQSSGKLRRPSLKKALSIKSSEERVASKTLKLFAGARELRDSIVKEESGRWPCDEDKSVVYRYQDNMRLTRAMTDMRNQKPLQYLHLLRAGYFEPIPLAWAKDLSSPLRFTIDAAAGWRGITPTWRGFQTTGEERLQWVVNHRSGNTRGRERPNFFTALNQARTRMAQSVPCPSIYRSPYDTCFLKTTATEYSKQIIKVQDYAFNEPSEPTDETMILLDVSGSMDRPPRRSIYDQYLLTEFVGSSHPRNKDVAQSIIRRFTQALANHDQNRSGYELTTFSSKAENIGHLNYFNFEDRWLNIKFGGRARVMIGWQSLKERFFQKHASTAIFHPIYGWQAGPQTPKLRTLLVFDGEVQDIDDFELDLLSSPWAHVTILLIGADECPRHHQNANRLQSISDPNPRVSFVDAQGNVPERFIVHELLKRHLGRPICMGEFEQLELVPGQLRPFELPAREPPPPHLPELEQPGPPPPVELASREILWQPELEGDHPPPYSVAVGDA